MSLESISLINFFKTTIDQARHNPQAIIHHLHQRQFDADNQYQHSLLPNIKYRTQQGEEAVLQAIKYLETCPRRRQLILSEELCEAAYQAGLKMAKEKLIQNPEMYSYQINEQVRKFARGKVGEITIIVEYGFRNDPQIIPSIIVDDGDKKRTRRYELMHPQTKYIGIGVHEHSQYDYMLLILLTDKIEEGGCECRIF